jgi:hypothetical protein
LSTFEGFKNHVLKLVNVLIWDIEVSQRIVVLTFFGIVVQDLTVRIVKRTFESLARTELFAVLEDNVRHKTLSTD